MKLKLGDGLQIPIEVAGQAVALVGIRGSGKTNTAGVIAEELLDRGQQVVVLDPTDAWWGLRSDYPVFIFGGPHGDLPLTETDGKTLAEFVVQEKVPIILSLRHLRKGAQRRLVMEFCEELYHLKGKPEYRDPLTVFIDEAPQFVPQRVMGEMARLVGAVQDMILLGRNAGFGVVLISQRFATLNADVRTQADTVVVHRLPSPLDRKALTEWIEENATLAEQKDVLSSLAKLATGEAWVWSPFFDLFKRAQIRPRRTFDSSAAPKRGAPARAPKDLTKVDIEKLKGKLSDAIEKAKADDPRELRKQIADLTKQLAAKVSDRVKEALAPKRIEVEILTAGDRELLAKLEDAIRDAVKYARENIVAAESRAERLAQTAVAEYLNTTRNVGLDVAKELATRLERVGVAKALDKLTGINMPSRRDTPTPNATGSRTTPAASQGRRVAPVAATSRPAALPPSVHEGVSKAEQRVLDAVAWWHAAGIAEPTRLQVAMVARYTVNGHFNNLVGGLRTKGLVDYPTSGGVLLTDTGRAAANAPDGDITREELIARVLQVLRTESLQRIFRAVVDAGADLTREELAERTNYTVNGHFNNMVGSLRSLGVIDYPSKGGVTLSDIFNALA